MKIHIFIPLMALYCLFACTSEKPPAKPILPDNYSFSKDNTGILPDTTIANEFYDKAKKYRKDAQYDSSSVYFKKAYIIYEKIEDWEEYIECLNLIGDNYERRGEHKKAIEYLDKALAIALEKVGEKHPLVVSNYINRGLVYADNGYFEKALESYHKSLAILSQLKGENHQSYAANNNNIGLIYWNKGNYDKAVKYFNKALAILLKFRADNHQDIAITYSNIGQLYGENGDYDKCIEYLNKALSVLSLSYDKGHLNYALIFHNLGFTYYLKGDFDKALQYYDKSLSIRRKALGEDHQSVAWSYDNIGLVYSKKGEYEKALEYEQKSLNIALNTFGENHPDVSEFYYGIGIVYADKGEYARAIEYFNKSIMIGKKIGGEHHPDVAEVYIDLAKIFNLQKNFDKSLAYAQKAIICLLPDFADASIYANPALENILSEKFLLTALTVKAEALAKIYSLDTVLSKDGEISNDLKDIKMSFATYQLASDLIDKMRSGYRAEGSKLHLAEKASQIYDKAIRTTLKLYDITAEKDYQRQAFQFAEKNKASVLSQALHESQAKQFAGIPADLLKKEQELRIDLAFYETELQKRKSNKNESDPKISEFEERFFTLKQEYERLIDRFENEFPRYYELKYQTVDASVNKLQQMLDEQTTVVEFFTGDHSIVIFVIDKTHFEVLQIEKDKNFEMLVKQFLSGIAREDYDRYTENAYQLYASIFEPVVPYLLTDNLIIIPDGILNNVPFEALLSSKVSTASQFQNYQSLPYLVEKYTLSYAYSANLLLETNRGSKQPVKSDFLAFAPVFSAGISDNSPLSAFIERNRALDSSQTKNPAFLPASRAEVLDIRSLFSTRYDFLTGLMNRFFANKTRVCLDAEAKESVLKNIDLNEYRYVHFATHAFVNKNKPGLCGIVFASESDSTEDGILYLPEIYNLNLNAELAVLSACESGRGKLAKGEGLIGLTRGFHYAGAKNLLVSQWKVSDIATADLMIAFYDNMLSGQTKSAALRTAKSLFINQKSEFPDYAKPRYWAPFILIGI